MLDFYSLRIDTIDGCIDNKNIIASTLVCIAMTYIIGYYVVWLGWLVLYEVFMMKMSQIVGNVKWAIHGNHTYYKWQKHIAMKLWYVDWVFEHFMQEQAWPCKGKI